MKDGIFKAALAGLLHDVGKFAQRAAEGLKIAWSDDENSDIKKRYRHQHALYTDQVVEQIVPDKWRQEVRAGAGHHHNPQTHLERVVALADHLSAGERADDTGKHPRQLQSIFCSITGLTDEDGKLISAPKEKYLPLKKLAIEQEVIFPVDTIDDSHGTYKELWDGFEAEALALKRAFAGDEADPTAYLESLLNLMQQYTWCIPSAYYNSVPDVSLYDHSRMTAALAACLVEQNDILVQDLLDALRQWHQEQKLAEKQGRNPDAIAPPSILAETDVALLVGGDISGVQRFIYNITSRGATPGLRGRSMYLQLLTEVVARYLLNELGLPPANIIYAGGGHLYLIAPLSAQSTLEDLQKQIGRILLHHHQGDLYLALTATEVKANEFKGELFHTRWDSLQKKLQEIKQRKFAELGDELAWRLFTPMEDGGNEEKQCVVCRREHPKTETRDPENAERTRKCPVCEGFEALGDKLRSAQYLYLDKIEPYPEPNLKAARGDWQQILGHFGYRVSVNEKRVAPPNKQESKQHVILALNNLAGERLEFVAGQTIGRRFLVNVTPKLTAEEVTAYSGKIEEVTDLRPGAVKPFEILVEQSRGVKRLGVLRMDVDNLGQIFSQGLPKNNFTISRMATLSFNLSLFFEGWVAQLAQEVDQTYPYTIKDPNTGRDKQFNRRLYSIYSGGDDLFFVGAWDVMPALAERISRDLQAYSAQHPGVHISGGVALASAKYPLYQAAEDAAEAEDKAKSTRPDGRSKNALAFLDEVIPWEKFEEVNDWQSKLVGLVEPKDGRKAAPRNLLQRLRELYIAFDDQRKTHQKAGQVMQVYWGPGQWFSAYSLSRLAQQHKNDEHIKDALLEIRNSLSLEQFTNIQWLGLAARWAALLTRKGE